MLSLSLFLLCDFPFATYIVRYFLSAVQQAVSSNRLAAFLHAACVKGSAEASNAISAQHASLWINIAEVYYLLYCWSSVMISAVLHSLTLTLPPTASSDFFIFFFCSDCICLQTYPRRWAVWARGSWQERPLRLRPAVLPLPAPNTWTFRGLAQSLRATNTWNAAVDVPFAAANRLLPHPRSVNCNHPTSHYHLPNDPARGEDLNIHNTSTLNGHAYSHISTLILTDNAHIPSCHGKYLEWYFSHFI